MEQSEPVLGGCRSPAARGQDSLHTVWYCISFAVTYENAKPRWLSLFGSGNAVWQRGCTDMTLIPTPWGPVSVLPFDAMRRNSGHLIRRNLKEGSRGRRSRGFIGGYAPDPCLACLADSFQNAIFSPPLSLNVALFWHHACELANGRRLSHRLWHKSRLCTSFFRCPRSSSDRQNSSGVNQRGS